MKGMWKVLVFVFALVAIDSSTSEPLHGRSVVSGSLSWPGDQLAADIVSELPHDSRTGWLCAECESDVTPIGSDYFGATFFSTFAYYDCEEFNYEIPDPDLWFLYTFTCSECAAYFGDNCDNGTADFAAPSHLAGDLGELATEWKNDSCAMTVCSISRGEALAADELAESGDAAGLLKLVSSSNGGLFVNYERGAIQGKGCAGEVGIHIPLQATLVSNLKALAVAHLEHGSVKLKHV